MNEKFNTESVRQMLNRSAARLDQPTLDKLRAARAQALARYDARSTAPVSAWAGALPGPGRSAGLSRKQYYYWAAAVLLAASLFSGIAYWKHSTDREVSEVDIAILTDDLPIEMYVD